ncbi:MAG TPA: CocE/NonD family hydrolase C-terminal non-catalytic domain-containing protein, partial [Chitinophagaceae bacterium]
GRYLCFVSDTLADDCELNGSFMAHLEFIVNKKDVDLAINLYEQLADGSCIQLSNNVLRASLNTDPGKRKVLTPGKVSRLDFKNTFFTSRNLRRGSRIVLLVGVNKERDWQINYGTGIDVSKESIKDAKEPLRIDWVSGKSFIQLPVYR